MKLKVYFFGKKNEITEWEQKYCKRIGFRAQIELIPLHQAGLSDVTKTKSKEADNFLNKISDQLFVVALDENGQSFDSPGFSAWLKERLVDHGQVVFVVGGAHGLDDRILARANAKLRLGKMVWTRNLARLMLLEQLYRALEIDGGSNFHKR